MVARFEQSNRNNQTKYKLENSILLLSLPRCKRSLNQPLVLCSNNQQWVCM